MLIVVVRFPGSTTFNDLWFGPLLQPTPDTTSADDHSQLTAAGLLKPDPSSGCLDPDRLGSVAQPEDVYSYLGCDFDDPAVSPLAVCVERHRIGARATQTAGEFREWAVTVASCIEQDESWERAAAAFLGHWRRLPTTARRSGLHRFGGTATQLPTQPASTDPRGRPPPVSAGRPCKAQRTAERDFATAPARPTAELHSLVMGVSENPSVDW